jgi:peptidoglycan-N-acetylglucosamine deacetylase
MLKFRLLNIFTITTLLLVIAYDYFYSLSISLYVVIVLAYSLILFYGCYFIGSQFFMNVICKGPVDRRQVALTFDDGPHSENTDKILLTLKNTNTKAAFFCIGKNISGNEYLLNRINAEGHLIGNHSYSHDFWFDMYSSRKMTEDLKRMNDLTQRTINLQPGFFRPPYGVTNPNLAKAVSVKKMLPIGWNIRSLDTVIRDKEKLTNKILKSLSPGAIILMHDTSKIAVDALPGLIQRITESGYEIVRLDKLINEQPYV